MLHLDSLADTAPAASSASSEPWARSASDPAGLGAVERALLAWESTHRTQATLFQGLRATNASHSSRHACP